MALWTLYKRELNTYFQSAVAYIVLFGTALIQSLLFIVLLRFIIDANYKDQSVMQIFFTWPLFFLFFLAQIPLITMRVFSEEFKLGTIEMLLTAPVTEWDVVLAKFFGALTFSLILWLPIILDLSALQLFSNPRPPVYWSQVGLTALTVALASSLYVSIGVLSSVLTRNQIIAAVLCFAFLVVFFLVSLWRWVQHMDETTLSWISYVSLPEHLQNAVLGIFDTRPLVFYISLTAFMLMITKSLLKRAACAAEPRPAMNAEPPSARSTRRSASLQILLNLVLAAVILVLANYLGFKHYDHKDLSASQYYVLSTRPRRC
ncbi:MAG: ABC transporter permease [Verrucomicrobiota bacterium]